MQVRSRRSRSLRSRRSRSHIPEPAISQHSITQAMDVPLSFSSLKEPHDRNNQKMKEDRRSRMNSRTRRSRSCKKKEHKEPEELKEQC